MKPFIVNKPLTPRQRQVLVIARAYQAKRGRVPGATVLQRKLGTRSHSYGLRVIAKLIARGELQP